MNLYKKAMIGIALTLASGAVFAARSECAVGRIVEISEGWGNNDHLLVKLDYTGALARTPDPAKVLLPDEADNNNSFWMRFNVNNLTPERLKVLRAVAYLSLANGNTVKLWSKQDGDSSCLNLSQINVISTQID